MNNLRGTPTIAAFVSGVASQPAGLGWALWPVAAALTWLLPTHADPWTTFYSEWLTAVVLVPVAAWMLLAARGGWQVDLPAAVIGLVAVIPIAQALAGLYVFPREALLICFYITGFALTIAVARRAQEFAPLRLADALFASLVIAALLSTGMALCQWLGLDALGVMLAPTSYGGRATANVGQPNNLSTLLVWGVVAVWWGHSRQRIGSVVATFAVGFILVGVVLTQSRTGWLAVGLLGAAALLGRRILRTGPQALTLAALAIWFVALIQALEPLSQLLSQDVPRSLSDRASVNARLVGWRMTAEAIWQNPWLGYGWQQSAQAHVALADKYPGLNGTLRYAHNMVLDLVMWNGLPLGALLTGAIAVWLWCQLRRASSAPHLLLLVAVGVLLLHAMLEFPHAYAYFLLPLAILIGTANAMGSIGAVASAPRAVMALLVAAHAVVLVVMFDEYTRIEADVMTARLREARIANVVPVPVPNVQVLQPLEAALAHLRTEPRREMEADELAQLRRALTRYPTSGGLFRYAQASVLNGRPEDARWALAVLCDIHSKDLCEAAARDWRLAAADGNAEMDEVVVPLPR